MAQGTIPTSPRPATREYIELDLSTVVPSLRRPEASPGPHRRCSDAKDAVPHGPADLRRARRRATPGRRPPSPSRRATPARMATDGTTAAAQPLTAAASAVARRKTVSVTVATGPEFEIDHGVVSIAAITSCTNTSNPPVMIGAALLAKNAVESGLTVAARGSRPRLAPGLQGRHGLLRAGRA